MTMLQWVENSVDELSGSVDGALSFINRELPVAQKSLGIWGHSMGGFIAIASAVRVGGFAAVCASQSSIGRRGFSKEEIDSWRSTGWASFANEHFATLDLPYDFYIDRDKYDVFEVIGRLNAPLYLISGTFDELASVEQVESIYKAAPQPKLYREFPADHHYKHDVQQLAAINESTVEFFVKYLR